MLPIVAVNGNAHANITHKTITSIPATATIFALFITVPPQLNASSISSTKNYPAYELEQGIQLNYDPLPVS
jgi:hypothetical protein